MAGLRALNKWKFLTLQGRSALSHSLYRLCYPFSIAKKNMKCCVLNVLYSVIISNIKRIIFNNAFQKNI
jgi:hypothetical protein